MKTQMKKRTKLVGQAGFTLIEVLVAIVIGVAVIGVATGGITNLFGTSDFAEETQNIGMLYANTKTLKTASGYGTSGSDLTAQLIATSGVPKNVTVVGGVMNNPYGGSIVPLSTGTGFTITDSGLPIDSCIKIVAKVSKAGNWSTIKINANAAIAGEVTAATATTQCNAASNTVVYTSNS